MEKPFVWNLQLHCYNYHVNLFLMLCSQLQLQSRTSLYLVSLTPGCSWSVMLKVLIPSQNYSGRTVTEMFFLQRTQWSQKAEAATMSPSALLWPQPKPTASTVYLNRRALTKWLIVKSLYQVRIALLFFCKKKIQLFSHSQCWFIDPLLICTHLLTFTLTMVLYGLSENLFKHTYSKVISEGLLIGMSLGAFIVSVVVAVLMATGKLKISSDEGG